MLARTVMGGCPVGLLDIFKKKKSTNELSELQRARDFMLPPDVTSESRQAARDLMEEQMREGKEKRADSERKA